MDILLAHGYYLHQDAHERQIMRPYAPLGLLYLSSYLKSKGFDVGIYDSTFQTFPDFSQHLDEARAPVVGIYANMMTRATVLQMLPLCRERGATVVVGGPGRLLPRDYASGGGRGGHRGGAPWRSFFLTWPATAPEAGRDPGWAIAGDRVVTTPPRPCIGLDRLPFPGGPPWAWGSTWTSAPAPRRGSLSLPARGCPYCHSAATPSLAIPP